MIKDAIIVFLVLLLILTVQFFTKENSMLRLECVRQVTEFDK
jgi:regulatory protein YycI of two-component signal transduction system YycFG